MYFAELHNHNSELISVPFATKINRHRILATEYGLLSILVTLTKLLSRHSTLQFVNRVQLK